MVKITGTMAVLLGGAACASAFMGSVGSFSGMRVIQNVNTVAPARRTSVVTPRMGGKENAIRYVLSAIRACSVLACSKILTVHLYSLIRFGALGVPSFCGVS